ncbi:ABC transporter A, ABCA [Kipferlia bialata]|uniref:ABC transporter A, ABCA n=1 Tax=Kipferlia bialata TaxID=797122 RepID=A0A391NRC9_9EUKA|nr:ABC transporter A, ABCA [Kipferlia bialata]|eukprot:g12420.t1
MEEADALCTRIGIMAFGEMQGIGTQTHLKGRHGKGYNLTVVVDKDTMPESALPPGEAGREVPIGAVPPIAVDSIVLRTREEQEAHSAVTHTLGRDTVSLTSAYSGTLVYQLHLDTRIASIFSLMEELSANRATHIVDWGLSQTTLESVFIKLVESAC